jgi:hypothetical protein
MSNYLLEEHKLAGNTVGADELTVAGPAAITLTVSTEEWEGIYLSLDLDYGGERTNESAHLPLEQARTLRDNIHTCLAEEQADRGADMQSHAGSNWDPDDLDGVDVEVAVAPDEFEGLFLSLRDRNTKTRGSVYIVGEGLTEALDALIDLLEPIEH